MNTGWFKGQVENGDGSGKKIGFPTVNLNPEKIKGTVKEGIYACLVRHRKQVYKGVLFYGPRLIKGESHNVLEIHIIDFDKNVYGQDIEYNVKNFIRDVRNFSSIGKLKKEISKDVAKSLKLLNKLRNL